MYDITTEDIIDWAQNYASDEELEQAAKAIYSIYVLNRKEKAPEKHKANKAISRQLHKSKKKPLRYPKGYRKYEKPLEQNKIVPIVEYRK